MTHQSAGVTAHSLSWMGYNAPLFPGFRAGELLVNRLTNALIKRVETLNAK